MSAQRQGEKMEGENRSHGMSVHHYICVSSLIMEALLEVQRTCVMIWQKYLCFGHLFLCVAQMILEFFYNSVHQLAACCKLHDDPVLVLLNAIGQVIDQLDNVPVPDQLQS